MHGTDVGANKEEEGKTGGGQADKAASNTQPDAGDELLYADTDLDSAVRTRGEIERGSACCAC